MIDASGTAATSTRFTGLEHRSVHGSLTHRENRGHAGGDILSSWPVVVAVAVVAAGVAWLRMPEPVAGQLYAEDGPLFFLQGATEGASAILAPYAGYQHLVPRLLAAAIAAAVPVTGWAVATNAAACLVIGLVAAVVVVCSRDTTRSPLLRILLALVPAIAPFASVEAIGNLANLHWFLLYAMVWLLIATPRSPVGASVMAFAALLATLTETQCVLLLPIVLWRVWRDARRVWPVAAAWAVGSLVQVASFLAAPRLLPTGRPPLASVVEGYVVNVAMGSFSVRPDVLRWGFEHLWVGTAVLLLGVALVLTAAVLARASTRLAVVALAYGSLASWTASFVLGANPGYYYSEMPWTDWMLVRWGTAASMLFLAAVLLSLDVVGQQWRALRAPAAVARLAVAALLVLGAPFAASAGGSTWQARVVEARSECAGGVNEAVVTTAPALRWQVRMPCSLLR